MSKTKSGINFLTISNLFGVTRINIEKNKRLLQRIYMKRNYKIYKLIDNITCDIIIKLKDTDKKIIEFLQKQWLSKAHLK